MQVELDGQTLAFSHKNLPAAAKQELEWYATSAAACSLFE